MTRKQYRLQTLIRSESRAFAESAAGAGKTGRPPADCAGACPLPQDLSENQGGTASPSPLESIIEGRVYFLPAYRGKTFIKQEECSYVYHFPGRQPP